MPGLMRCKYCGTLQDEPTGAKLCVQCGGELVFESLEVQAYGSYVRAYLELDQVSAPAGQTVERHLILTVETPDELPMDARAPTVSGREPLNFVAVLDVSGSMNGSKIQAAKDAVRQAAYRLQDGDWFSLITFSTDVRCPLEPRQIDGGYRRVIESALQEIQAGGQTALCGGLEMGIDRAEKRRLKTNLVLLLSDGQANVGETGVEAVGKRALAARKKGITVSTLGVGNDYNEALMTEIALDGGGRFYHVANAAQIAAYLGGELGEVAALAARQAVVSFDLPAGAALFSFSTAYPVQGHTVGLGDIPLSTRLEVVVRVVLPPQPVGTHLTIGGRLRYESPAGRQLTTDLNQVTVRYQPTFVFDEGVVRPVVRRVLEQMQSAGVLAVSRAAARSDQDAQRQHTVELEAIRRYASLLGQDDMGESLVHESEKVLNLMASGDTFSAAEAKLAVHRAMQRHRGSKDFI